jgi:intracellular sulfur oxidation DsrE/DsrF family protein
MMADIHSRQAVARRSFLTRLGAGAAAFGAAFSVGDTAARAQGAVQAGPWQPARHAEDDWLEEGRAKHRFFFDTSEVRGLGHAIFWANNYCTVSRGANYGLTDADSSVVVCLRHESAPFAFTDAMWAKYGPALSEHAAFVDPKTKQPATVNVFQASGYNDLLSSRGVTLAAIIGHGVRFAVCTLATRGIAGQAARVTGGKVDDIFKELTENKIANAHMVPAGIVAVNRAQERGFSISSVT